MIKPNEKVFVVSGSSMKDYITTEEPETDVLGANDSGGGFKDSKRAFCIHPGQTDNGGSGIPDLLSEEKRPGGGFLN